MLNFTASIMNAEGTDLEDVDLRGLDSDKLRVLRHEAGVADDDEMVLIIDSILADAR